jgi:hypothetical protein
MRVQTTVRICFTMSEAHLGQFETIIMLLKVLSKSTLKQQ